MTPFTANFQVGVSLASVLVLLLSTSLQTTVFACDAPQDADPIVIGVAGDKFIAIYKTSDAICFFEQPASGVSGNKTYLGKSGKALKEVWPELELPPSVFAAVLVTDSKGGHFILFQVTKPTTPPPRHKKKKKRAASMMSSLGDDGPQGNIVFDVDKKKVVSKEATPYLTAMSVSSKEPMTMYQAELGDKSSHIYKLSFEGDSLAKSNIKVGDTYKLCPSGGNGSAQLVATKSDENDECDGKMPDVPDGPVTGFADDKNFHMLVHGKVISFEKDAIGEKLGKPVPLTIADSKDFFVKEDVPGGGGGGGNDSDDDSSGRSGAKDNSTLIVIVIAVLVILLIMAAVTLFCCCSSNKKGSGGGGHSSGGHSGGRSSKKKKKGSRKSKKSSKKSKKGSSKLRSSRSRKLSSKKSSKKGGGRSSRLSSRRKSKRSTVSSRKLSNKASSKKSSKR